MQHIKRGHAGLEVSPIPFGRIHFGDLSLGDPVWSLGEEDSGVLNRRAVEAGINLFDTANQYSIGNNEILDWALEDFISPNSVAIVTKLSAPTRNGTDVIGLSRKAIMTEIDHSLKPLRVTLFPNTGPDKGLTASAARVGVMAPSQFLAGDEA